MAEKLKINTTPATLFVGVGGIGSQIVVKVAERCAPGETKNIRFVSMDTNANDLKQVGKSKAKIVSVQTSSTQSVLDYLKNDDDARNNWFPNNTTLYPKTVSEGAGQVRAISRLALNATIKTGEITKLYKTIDELFLKDGSESKQALRVVIVSSASGGTGSGIAMSIGMLIREYLHKHYREKSAIIRGFLLLPGVMDTVIRSEKERQSQRRNGYATIKEINAFMIKASGFCGVRKDLERFKGLHADVPTTTQGVETLESLPFDFCFLLDRIGKDQESMQTLDQYKEFAAQSLYEQNIGPMQGNAFSIEDNIIKEFAEADNLGRNRFGGIGASIIRYPYEDVADYIAYGRAMERIGDGESAGDWLKYDKKFKEARAEFKKRRATTIEKEPTIEDVYTSELENDDKRFGIDVKSYLARNLDDVASEVSEKIDTFIASYKNEILETFVSMPEVTSLNTQVEELRRKKEYENQPSERNKANDNLSVIRSYEVIIKKLANTVAKAKAKGILHNAPSVAIEVQPYHLESLFKTTKGAMHPNAVRYILYKLKAALNSEYEEVIKVNLRRLITEDLPVYSPAANNPKLFDVDFKAAKQEEKSIDDVCALEKKDPSTIEKLGGYKHVWDALNKHLPGYSTTLLEYRDAVVYDAAYAIAIEYINRICAEYEKFYASFDAKVVGLQKQREEIVNKLAFKKGNNIRYVCGDKEYLDRFADMCPEGDSGLLLPDELNAEIFEAVKVNAESDRLAQYDPYGENQRADIFDKVLIGYFRDSIREDCDEIININIIQALATEQKFKAYFEAKSLADDDEAVIMSPIDDEKRIDYLIDNIKLGTRLASPGVGCANFGEPRDIKACSFNLELLKLRDIEIKKLIEPYVSPVATDTVSKYDFRFYSALYNITPDQLAKFKSPEECTVDDLYTEGAGIYYQAYHDYIKNIGPDSTKSATISLHIDKRWDSLTEMPEISMTAHYKDMIKIHSALVYGIVYGMIKTHQSSKYDAQKRIYALEDTEGELTTLIVSNNTECDEFYEVLDALYRDRASVAKIYEMAAERCKYDVECNRRYSESAFLKDTRIFKIGDGHAAPTSLFEIPLMYYNSLPKAKMDDNELSVMIESVINVIETEVNRYEQEVDRAPFLASRLEDQFRLLIDNFNSKAFDIKKNTTIEENRVINMVFRKVSNKIKALNIYKFSDKIDELRALIVTPADETAAEGAEK
ncbi:MAG: hypothetical protein IJO03_09660 [Clostridia bacterium]|nr:hypothetical protein [Clostridia bacterium]MBQ7122513.1 hypothetical protein [Clostridia bacterium]